MAKTSKTPKYAAGDSARGIREMLAGGYTLDEVLGPALITPDGLLPL
jgi:hypothetical protein